MSKSNKIIINAALTGAGTEGQNVPITPEKIAADAVAVAKAGATLVHFHVRDENGKASMETKYFEQVFYAVQDACIKANVDIIVNLTTSNRSTDDELRLAHLRKLRPEVCSCDCGTMNWQYATIFENSPRFLEKLGLECQKLDIKPEVEVFDASWIDNVNHYVSKGVLKSPIHIQFVLGVMGGLPGTIDSLNFLLPKIPKDATWSATGIGKAHIPVMLAALSAGADCIRAGLEDNIYYAKGVQATNAMLVERAVKIAQLAGREIATAQEAREILGITRKSW
jgi:uncharacterized protein (DUF849 family)